MTALIMSSFIIACLHKNPPAIHESKGFSSTELCYIFFASPLIKLSTTNADTPNAVEYFPSFEKCS